jgi:peptide/nickel transport system permease protein
LGFRKYLSLEIVWLSFIFLMFLVSLFWTPYSTDVADGYNVLQGRSSSHIMGTSASGKDMFSLILAGSKTTILICTATTVLTAALGMLLAFCCRFSLVRIVVDIFIALPTIIVAMVLAASLGGSLFCVVASCSFSYSMVLARILHPEITRLEGSTLVKSLRALGSSKPRIIFKHILPNLRGIFFIQLTTVAATVILAEAGLTYLGYGAPLGTPSWGEALRSSSELIRVAPASVIWPGIFITLTSFSLISLGKKKN